MLPAPAPVAAAQAPAAPKQEAAPKQDNLVTIKSPMIGTFYRQAGPGKPIFVNVGDEVSPVKWFASLKPWNSSTKSKVK